MKIKKLVASLAFALTSVTAHASIVDGHFSTNQIFDVQYYWSGTTLYASNFIAPYDSNFTHPTVTSGQYFAFFPSTTNPGTYGLALYNSNGTVAQVLHNTGTMSAIGPDAIFYVGSGFFGTVITTSAGYSYGQSGSFTNMDTSVSSNDLTGYTWASTTPLASGQTASSTPSAPTVVSTAAGTPIVSTSTLSSNSSTTNSIAYTTARGSKNLVVTKTTTPVTTTTTVTRTSTTPTTVTTYSDNTSTTTNGTTATVDTTTTTVANGTASAVDYTTRIDQLSTLDSINQRLNRSNNNDMLSRQSVKDNRFAGDESSTVYVIGQGQRSNTVDSYKHQTSRYGIGADFRVDHDWIVGAQFVRNNTDLTGIQAGGSLDKDVFSLHSAYTQDGWIISNEVGVAKNKYKTNHSLSELSASNSAQANGSDTWALARVYTPDLEGFRPYAGVRWERNQRDAVIESGTSLTAVSHDKLDNTKTSTEVGIRYETLVDGGKVYAELGRTNQQLATAQVGVTVDVEKDTALRIQAGEERQHGTVNRMIQAGLRWLF